MTDSDNAAGTFVDEALAYIEAVNNVVSMVDSIKTGLEERGWAPSPASHAATTLGNTLLMAGALSAEKKA